MVVSGARALREQSFACYHAGKMQELDDAFEISSTGNNEVLFVWLMKAIDRKYTPAYGKLREFLVTVGRRKFVKPLYEELVRTDQRAIAQKIYQVARPHYHAVTVGSVDALLASNSKSN